MSMIRRRTQLPLKNNERGVTMILVVLAMLSMLGIIALAIDVITLYSARSETQRAADSAALAAAKMLVDMGVTTDPTATVPTAAQIDAATKAAQSVAINLSIAARQVQTTDVSLLFPGSGTAAFSVNPKVTVTVQNANLPTFFARIWSRAALTVRATATAEGFNPSNSASIGGTAVPIIAKGVKPFLIPNCDPGHAGAGCGGGGGGATFFNPATGAITNPGPAPTGIIGETFNLSSNCGAGPGCVAGTPNIGPPNTLEYYPVTMPLTASTCPSSCGGGGTTFEDNIECSNPTPISCGTTVTAPAVNQLFLDDTVFPDGGGGPAQSGVECLIHQRPGNGMDTLNAGPPLTYPLQIQVGNNHPLAGTVLSSNDLVTTSDSLVTIPIYDQTVVPNAPSSTTAVTVIGFLQVFIVQAFPAGGGPKAGSFDVTVVNVSGCGNAASGTPVMASSAVPVRLIQQ
jgi:Flp pilus assembly protein TadG